MSPDLLPGKWGNQTDLRLEFLGYCDLKLPHICSDFLFLSDSVALTLHIKKKLLNIPDILKDKVSSISPPHYEWADKRKLFCCELKE